MKTTKKKLTPRAAKTFNQLCDLPRDNLWAGDFCLAIDGDVVEITLQLPRMPVEQRIQIPKKLFNKLIDWYNGVKK